MTKTEKIALVNEMLLIEREESAVTGSRLSIWPFSAATAVTQTIQRAFLAKGKTAKKKAATRVTSKRSLKRSTAKKAIQH